MSHKQLFFKNPTFLDTLHFLILKYIFSRCFLPLSSILYLTLDNLLIEPEIPQGKRSVKQCISGSSRRLSKQSSLGGKIPEQYTFRAKSCATPISEPIPCKTLVRQFQTWPIYISIQVFIFIHVQEKTMRGQSPCLIIKS